MNISDSPVDSTLSQSQEKLFHGFSFERKMTPHFPIVSPSQMISNEIGNNGKLEEES